MRYFIGKDTELAIRDKQVFGGDESKADNLVAAYLTAHPGWTSQEVDQMTFDAAVAVALGPTQNSTIFYAKCNRNGSDCYVSYEAQSKETVTALLEDLGATNIEFIIVEDLGL